MNELARDLILIFGPMAASALVAVVYWRWPSLDTDDSFPYIALCFIAASFVLPWLGFMWLSNLHWIIRFMLSVTCACISFVILLVLTVRLPARSPTE